MVKTNKRKAAKAVQRPLRDCRRLRQFRSSLPYYIMLIIPVAYFLIFRYWPMFGLAMSFQDYKLGDPFIGIGANWVGLKWFKRLFSNPMFGRWIKNTLVLSFYNIFISFPISVLMALFLNEIRQKKLQKFTSTLSLLPYFISTVVVVGMIVNFFSVDDGIVNRIIMKLGGEKIDFMGSNNWFRTLYVGSGIWQTTGFNAVVFTAAISGIDPNLYEAAYLDGSTRVKNILYVTIPCILPTVITMFLLRLGSFMSVGYEKIILMYSPAIYETADTLSTYAYRAGILDGKTSFATAVDMFNGICNLILLVSANKISKKVSETSLW